MQIAEIVKKMIEYSEGNLHDINHFMKVWGYARTISELENIDDETKNILQIAAIIHDIACPICRIKYGNTNGKKQEEEGMILAYDFLKDVEISEEAKQRIIYLVGHHHTLSDINGIDYQILIEADYLVNADESQYSKNNIENMRDKVFKTATGKQLLTSIFLQSNKSK